MKFRRLKVENFGSVRATQVEFGPGLNLLYGPNDLGKSTLAEAIRLALLLPHGSSHCEPFVPWSGARGPLIELEFETAPAAIWSVRKEFGKSGSSLLRWSKNGRDFEDVEKARGVDKKLRELLQWGIPEPGGAGASKSFPSSFLATALLSTQADVTAVFRTHLGSDLTPTGKERISAALQALAQDPLFVSILRETQARRDEAFTATGARKSGKDSKLRQAAQLVTDRRKELEDLEKLVADSAGVEIRLDRLREQCDIQAERVHELAATLQEAETLLAASEQRRQAQARVEAARAEVQRIVKLGAAVESLAGQVESLDLQVETAQKELESAQARCEDAETVFRQAEETHRLAGADRSSASTVARQEAELRKAAAERAQAQAGSLIQAAEAALTLVAAEEQAQREWEDQERSAESSRVAAAQAEAQLEKAVAELARLERLELELAVLSAHSELDKAARVVEERQEQMGLIRSCDASLADLGAQRMAVRLPPQGSLARLRKLEKELARARGALEVGLTVTLAPARPLALRVGKDGQTCESVAVSGPLKVDAKSQVEIDIADVASLKVVGGNREAQERATALERRWQEEALPHLLAADVEDLEALERYVEETRGLDERIAAKLRERSRLQAEIEARQNAEEQLAAARAQFEETRAALGETSVDVASLGTDPARNLERLRALAVKAREEWRKKSSDCGSQRLVQEERSATRKARWLEWAAQREAAVAPFHPDVSTALGAAQNDLAQAGQSHLQAEKDLARLLADAEASAKAAESAMAQARQRWEEAKAGKIAQQAAWDRAKNEQATLGGKLSQARATQAAEDLPKAQAALELETAQLDAVPVPSRPVTSSEVQALQGRVAAAQSALDSSKHELHEAQGALKQVGGNIARERGQEVAEALRLAELHERALEADYDAWKLLLQQLKEADAAQASNLGQALAPAIASGFAAVTQQRYQGLQLDAQLGTQGILVDSKKCEVGRVSVGTREQLSTLYRLCLAEYLQSALLLDDQLVQSDAMRMDWFRALLAEKARAIQIVVLTCRPADYIAAADMPSATDPIHRDSDDGYVRAIDLHRAIRRS